MSDPFLAGPEPDRRRRAYFRFSGAGARSAAAGAVISAIRDGLTTNEDATRSPTSAVTLLVAWLVSASVFTVKETELAIKFRLREIVATDFEPGLHFKIPWIETVQKFDRRVLTRNYPAEPFLTSEGKILNVDFFVKWRVADVGKYYLATNGEEEAADDERQHPPPPAITLTCRSRSSTASGCTRRDGSGIP